MGKTKQTKEKKFDRKVEISAPIVDPELIKKFHSPTRGLDLRHGGFKALLSDPNSQDSTDEVTILDEYHIPSYIGIACAVSGYTSYSSQARRAREGTPNNEDNSLTISSKTNIRSRPTSPVLIKSEPQVHHITLDKSQINSPDDERRELTEKLTASANENLRSPSPTIPPTEDDRHHGAYVGARYFPLSPPSNVVNRHIPLLGIDDEANQDKVVDDENKVGQRIANLYGEDFASGWRESMSHKTKKELDQQEESDQKKSTKSPKDLVKLKPTSSSPTPPEKKGDGKEKTNAPLGKAKNFFSKMFGGSPNTPGVKSQPKTSGEEASTKPEDEPQHSKQSPTNTPPATEVTSQSVDEVKPVGQPEKLPLPVEVVDLGSQQVETKPDETEQANLVREQGDLTVTGLNDLKDDSKPEHLISEQDEPKDTLVNQTQPTIEPSVESHDQPLVMETQPKTDDGTGSEIQLSPVQTNDGKYYLQLLEQAKGSILDLVREAEFTLETREQEFDEDTVGSIRSAIGKANLLLQKKFKQFEELCDANINKPDEDQFATLNDDLAGFWDMLSIQINEVQNALSNMFESEKNSSVENTTNVKEKNQQSTITKPKLSAQKDQERREKLYEHINQMKQAKATNGSNEDTDLIAVSDSEQLLASDVESSDLTATSEQPHSLMGSELAPHDTASEQIQPAGRVEENLMD